MILINTINLTRTTATGDFYCPHCGVLRPYRLRSRRPFLTLYFIPIIPIGPAEEFVQCSHCKTNSPLVALEHDERSFRESRGLQFRYDAFHAAVMVATADGTISETEIDVLMEMGTRVLPQGLTREQLGAGCSSIRQNRIPPKNYIASVSKTWTVPQKRTALQLFFLAATADGELKDAKLKLLAWLSDHFGMSPAEYQEAINDAIEVGVVLDQ